MNDNPNSSALPPVNQPEPAGQPWSAPASSVRPSSAPTPNHEDIFAGVDPTPPPGSGLPSVTPMPRPMEPLQELPEMDDEGKKKKTFVILGAVVAIIVLAAGGWFAYGQWQAARQANQNNILNNQPATPELTNQPATPLEVADNDYDRDGLTNDEEQQLSTDPYNADTDNDGLYDRDEVKVWHTDPLNPDTDADGYLDGSEVNNGYDPRGAGKLLQLPTSTNP